MRQPVAAAVVNNSIRLLFQTLAPDYHPDFMLDLLPKECPNLTMDVLEIRTAEFLKFIYLRSTLKSSFVPVKKAIDEIWHIFIVQTLEYERLCQALPGRVFIHHTTMHLDTFAEKKDKNIVVKEMLEWIPRYLQHFGPFTEETAEYWMMPGFLQETLGMSLQDINML